MRSGCNLSSPTDQIQIVGGEKPPASAEMRGRDARFTVWGQIIVIFSFSETIFFVWQLIFVQCIELPQARVSKTSPNFHYVPRTLLRMRDQL